MNRLQRKVTIYLSAPPGDGLRPAREHFQEYVRPILVAAALDWEVVEGRREGDLRYKLAENVRRKRRKTENSTPPEEEDIIEETRQRFGIQEDQRGGDLILGRHTWKEYIRGLHEGWLGPVSAPPEPEPEPTLKSEPVPESLLKSPSEEPVLGIVDDDASPRINAEPQEEKAPEPEEPKPKPSALPPLIAPSAYSLAPTSQLPQSFPYSTVLPFPHLLGFLNTPIRIARFLNRRKLADETGQMVATFILSNSDSPYAHTPESSEDWEQKQVLESEEQDWPKATWKEGKEEEGEKKERPWVEEIVIDDRVGSRMRKTGEEASPPSEERTRGNYREWKGGVNTGEPISWGQFWLEAFDLYKEKPRCKGWEDGLKGEEGR